MSAHNLALLPVEQRAELDADKAACLIRYKVKDLRGKERQKAAHQLLDALPNAAQVMDALARRASHDASAAKR